MKNVLSRILLLLSTFRLIPHYIIFNFHPKNNIIRQDVARWLKVTSVDTNVQTGFLKLMTFYPEFRNLYYNRIGNMRFFFNFLCPKVNTLFIVTTAIGPGLFIQHGFATIIDAQSIGKNCWINQQVTIGYNGDHSPIIGDNVFITSGAKVLGRVIIGNNCIVGTNAVVVKSVPDNCTVVGVPAYIIKRDGVKVKEELV